MPCPFKKDSTRTYEEKPTSSAVRANNEFQRGSRVLDFRVIFACFVCFEVVIRVCTGE